MLRSFIFVLLAGCIVAGVYAYSTGAPNCSAPAGPHRASAAKGDGGHQVSITTSGKFSVLRGEKNIAGFLFVFPNGVEVCEVPEGMEIMVDKSCGERLALTHNSKVSKKNAIKRFDVRVGCGVGRCDGSILSYLLTSYKGEWFEINIPIPLDLKPCTVSSKEVGPMTPEEARQIAQHLLSGDQRLVRRPPLPSTLAKQGASASSSERLAFALSAGVIEAAVAAAALSVGASDKQLTHTAPVLVKPLVEFLSAWPIRSADATTDDKRQIGLAAAASAEALAAFIGGSNVSEDMTLPAIDPLCKMLVDVKAPPSVRMWAGVALAVAVQLGGQFLGKVELCGPVLISAVVTGAYGGIMHCPMPSCNPASLTSRSSMSLDHLTIEATAASAGEPWVSTWGFLILADAMVGIGWIDRLFEAGLRPALCFLRFAADELEGEPARRSLVAFAKAKGMKEKELCQGADVDARAYMKDHFVDIGEKVGRKKPEL